MFFTTIGKRRSTIQHLFKWPCQKRNWMSVAGIERSHRALLFPGQGSQVVGMGKDLWDRYPRIVKRVFDQVDDALNMPLRSLIFDGDQNTLTLTENAQPAILTTSIAILRILQEEYGFDLQKACAYVLGHSLGEYTALVASESLSLTDAVRLVRLRGLAMTQAVQDRQPTGMTVLVTRKGKLDEIMDSIQTVQKRLSTNEVAEIGNINSSTQIVISGTEIGLKEAVEYLKSKRMIVKSMPLPVSGPFHSSLVSDAAVVMSNALKTVSFKQPIVKVISNVTGKPYTSVEEIPLSLTKHITSTVQWHPSIHYLKTQDVSDFVSFGPGKVLANMLNKDYPSDTIRSLDSIDDILNYVQEFSD
ncbi:acyl transferase/acyl hydrolase/lysophospholipase [Halteromyces radiatus]|uniref:acyl transferase/acyl hydrolase/lysophospholipase n=1 Tax=Halteromyces radiatus TaxID=101107 RepID=UPI00221E4390|nr:acyl transferase/acyl hydrolase/lysophospholipase [Halteromyces radiatus]KAI8096421.1 acyl transferase/acyl hydrolase/lysophospholipase [Halteromyces radiatus]